MRPRRNVVIVDAYSPSRRLAPHFRQAGYDCVRVQSTPAVPAVYQSSFDLADYVANIIYEGSIEKTLHEVASYRPVAVLAGGEIGVELADALSEGLALPSNGTALSTARRDKYTMIETIRNAGLRAAKQLRIGSVEELCAWHAQVGGKIVLKPARSAASDGVRFCDSPDAAAKAYLALIDKTNVFSERNISVVAQEYLLGAEYIVNTVSCAGRHHVCDIWRTVHADVNGVLDLLAGLYVLPREGPIQEQLVSYAGQALDALGIKYGPAHIEIKMTPDGPCLVELGARIGGGDNPYYAQLATGESQLNWTVDAYVRPNRFNDRMLTDYRIENHVASAPMMSPYEGVLRSYPFLDRVKTLQSLHEIRTLVHPGETIVRSVDDTTYPLIVNLRHPVEEIIRRDMETLRYLDGHAFYDVI